MAIDIESLYTRYGPMVLRRCRSLLKNEERALDAMQDVFVNLLKNHSRLTDDYPSSLLFTMATHVCLNIIRTAKRRPETDADSVLAVIAAHDDSHQRLIDLDFLNHLFRRERASTRTIMTLLYVDHYTLEETARIVALSVSGVRKRVREFKARVQEAKEFDHER